MTWFSAEGDPLSADRRPHIVEIVVHDLGRHLHCYGWDSCRSPNIDRLASEGIRFRSAYAAAPLCTPSRACRVTGRYPHANGMMGLVHRGWRFRDGERYLPELLAQSGYRTLLFGFQHEMPDGQGAALGYQECREEAGGDEAAMRAFCAWARGPEPLRGPFYATVGFHRVHRDHGRGRFAPGAPDGVRVPPYLPDLPAVREDLASYEVLIGEADRLVGEVLQAIDRAGLVDRSLVVFTTDHGSDYPRAKSSLYDPGIETALIVRGPGGASSGAIVDALVSNVDILPTFLDTACLAAPENIQGHSFWPLLDGRPFTPRTEVFAERTWHATYDPIRCIRTHSHKLIRNFRPGRPLLVAPEFIEKVGVEEVERAFGIPRPEVELYDLREDPDELTNLAGVAAFRETEADLRSRLDHFLRTTEDPILAGDIPHPGRHDDVWDWRLHAGRWRLHDPASEVQEGMHAEVQR